MSAPIVDKVVAYITRENNGELQVLVFDHEKQWSDAGTQVPAGSVDQGESPKEAAIREATEETGLLDLKVSRKLETYEFFNTFQNQQQRRHVFHILAKNDTPDTWNHVVSGGELDKGMTFHCYWLSFDEAEERLSAGFASSIQVLRKATSKPQTVLEFFYTLWALFF